MRRQSSCVAPVQLVQRSSCITKVDPDAFKLNEPGVLVYSSLRGTGLLASAYGTIGALAACARVIAHLLCDAPIDKRQQQLAVGVRCDTLLDMAPATFLVPSDCEVGVEPGTRQVQYATSGVYKIGQVQSGALQRAKEVTTGVGMNVIGIDAMPGGMGAKHDFAHTISDSSDAESPRMRAIDENYTLPARADMRRRGGAYDKLAELRSAGKVHPYANKRMWCMLEHADDFPIDGFAIPEVVSERDVEIASLADAQMRNFARSILGRVMQSRGRSD